MNIVYDNDLLDQKAYFELFLTTGWNKEYVLGPEELFRSIQDSWYMVCAWHGRSLVGFGRIISDGVLHALIVDMMVRPDHQGKGISTAVLQRLLQRCESAEIRDVQLFCAKGKAGFCEKQGFRERSSDAPGMELPSWPRGKAIGAAQGAYLQPRP